MRAGAMLVVLAAVAAASACDRDSRVAQRTSPPAGARPQVVPQGPLEAGTPGERVVVSNPYEGEAHALEEGGRLYNWFNCSGCHFEGGGGIGPALMDDDWIYGGSADQIFDSIASGRANGMPAYGGRLASDEIWKIVTHVQSLDDEADQRPRRTPPASPSDDDP